MGATIERILKEVTRYTAVLIVLVKRKLKVNLTNKDNLNQSFLPESDGYPRSFDSVNLNMLIKLIYFEQQSNYQKITLKDLENFKEENLHQTQPNGGDFDFGSMLQMMGMGGGNEQQSNGDLGLASLLSGGGSGDIDQLLRAITNPNTQ